MGLLSPAVLVDGRVIGTWTRTLEGARAKVAVRLARRPTREETAALRAAVTDYGRYLGLDSTLIAGA
jgi:hypothetical protein